MLRFSMRALRGRRGGATAVHYGLLVALIGVATMGAVLAMSGQIGGNYGHIACTIQEQIADNAGWELSEACAALLDPNVPDPGADENPPEDANPAEVDLANLRFPDKIVEPGQYTVSDTIRVMGFEGTLNVGVASPQAGAQQQVSVAGAAFAATATLRAGETIRVRLRAAPEFSVARQATVTIGSHRVPAWTVTVRDRDSEPEPAFIARSTPWSIDYGSGVGYIVPPAETSPNAVARTVAMFPSYEGGTVDGFSAVPSVTVGGFDDRLPLTISLSGAPEGVVALAQRNGGAWVQPDAEGVVAQVQAGDRLAFAVDIPPNSYERSFAMRIRLGQIDTEWQVATRARRTVPDPMVFAPVRGLSPGNGTATVTSAVARVEGLEATGSLVLGDSRLAGAGLRVCASGTCDPAAAAGAGGWTAWGPGYTVEDGFSVQLRLAVPTQPDIERSLSLQAQTGQAVGTWTVSTVTDGPAQLTVLPTVDAPPNELIGSRSMIFADTVEPITVSVTGDARLWMGYMREGATSITVGPRDYFRITVRTPEGYGAVREVPLTVRGRDGLGLMRTWSDAWTPPPVWRITTRAQDSAPASFTIPPRDGAELDTAVTSSAVGLSGFDGTLPLSVTGPAGTTLAVFGPNVSATLEVGQSLDVPPGVQIVVRLRSSTQFLRPTAATVTLGSGATAYSTAFTVTSRGPRAAPLSLDFEPSADALPGSRVTSAPLLLNGFDSDIDITVAGEGNPQFRTGNPATWNEADWRSGVLRISPGVSLQLRTTAPGAYSTDRFVFASAGTADSAGTGLADVMVEGSWQVGTLSDTFEFPSLTGAEPDSLVTSRKLMLSGLQDGTVLALTGAEDGAILLNDVDVGTSTPASNGQVVQLRLRTPSGFDAQALAQLEAGPRQARWSVTTRGERRSPAASLVLQALTGLDPNSGRKSSNSVSPGDFDGELIVRGIGPLNPRVIVNGAVSVAEGSVRAGDTVALEVDAPADYDMQQAATLQVGGGAYDLSVSTRSRSWCPAGIAFAPLRNLEPGTQQATEELEVISADGVLPVTLRSTVPAELRVDGGAWGSAGEVRTGSRLQLRATTPSDPLAAGEVLAFFGTAAQCRIPWTIQPSYTFDPNAPPPPGLTFPDAANLEPGAPVRLDATPAPIALSQSLPLAVVEGEAQISVNNGTPARVVTVRSGDRIALVATAPSSFATVATVRLVFGSAASTVVLSTRPEVPDGRNWCPGGVAFPALVNLSPGTLQESAEIAVTASEQPSIPVRLNSALQAEMKVGDGPWTTSGTVTAGSRLRLRAVTPDSSLASGEVAVSFGPLANCTRRWQIVSAYNYAPTVPVLPELKFLDRDEVDPGAMVALDGSPAPIQLTTPVAMSVGSGAAISVNGGAATASATIRNGDRVVLQVTAPETFETALPVRVDFGSSARIVTVTTRAMRNTVTGLSFRTVTGVAPGARICHDPVVLSGFDLPQTARATAAGANPQVAAGDGPELNSIAIQAGQGLRVCATAPTGFQASAAVAVSVGTVSANWTLVTRAMDTEPDAIELEELYAAPESRRVQTDVVLSGFDGTLPATASASGPAGFDSQPQLSVNGGSATSGTLQVRAGDRLVLSMMTQGMNDRWARAQLRVGSAVAEWSAYTGPDNIPDPFNFADPASPVDPGATVSSAAVAIVGFEGVLPITLSGDPSGRLVIDGEDTGGQVSTVRPGQTVQIVTVAPDRYNIALVSTVTVGSYAIDTWRIATRGEDSTPDDFAFAATTGLVPGVQALSAAQVLKGFDGEQRLSIAVAPAGTPAEFSLDGGRTWATEGRAVSGNRVQLRVAASPQFATTRTASLTLGSMTRNWAVSTRAVDLSPDALGLGTEYDVATGARLSRSVRLSGFDGTMEAVLSDPGGNAASQPRLRLNGGPEVAGPVSVRAGDTLVLVHRTSSAVDQWTRSQVALMLNGAVTRSGILETYTGVDNIPNAFNFRYPDIPAEPNTVQTSETLTLGGFTGPLTATISGDATSRLVVNGVDTQAASAVVRSGDRLALRSTMPATWNYRLVATVTVGPYVSNEWVLQVRGFDNTPNNFQPVNLTAQVPSTTVTSAAFTVAGFDGQQFMSVTPSLGDPAVASDYVEAEFSTDNRATWKTSGFVTAGTTVSVRTRTHRTLGQSVRVAVQLGTYTATWTVATRAADTSVLMRSGTSTGLTAFPARTNAAREATEWSQAMTVYDFDGPLAATFTSRPGNAEMRVNGGSWTTSAQLRPNNQLEVRLTTPAGYNVASNVTIRIGTTNLTWAVTTETPMPVWVTAPDLAPMAAGEAITNVQFVAQTNVSGYTVTGYARTAGTLPPGLTLSAAGLLSGTVEPTATGVYRFSITPNNNVGRAGLPREFNVRVQQRPRWQTAEGDLTVLRLGQPAPAGYGVLATDADSAFAYALTAGALPVGLSFDTATGVISGTPTAVEHATFTVTVTDTTGLASARQFGIWTWDGATRAPVTVTGSASPPLGFWVPGDKILYAHTGNLQSFGVRNAQRVRVRLYGAQGGCAAGTAYGYVGCPTSQGGSGGYATGLVTVPANATYYVGVGGRGQNSSGSIDGSGSSLTTGGFNGGGNGSGTRGPAGGGRTDFRKSSTATEEVLVAGGGGGANSNGGDVFGGSTGSKNGVRVSGSNGRSDRVNSYPTDTGGGGGGYHGGSSVHGDDPSTGYGGSSWSDPTAVTGYAATAGINHEAANLTFEGTSVRSNGYGYAVIIVEEAAGVTN